MYRKYTKPIPINKERLKYIYYNENENCITIYAKPIQVVQLVNSNPFIQNNDKGYLETLEFCMYSFTHS